MYTCIDFDRPLQRRSSDAEMYSFYPGEILPMHLAETDFLSPVEVREQLAERVSLGHYGYVAPGLLFNDIVTQWLQKQHQLAVDPRWVDYSPSTGCAILYGIEMTSEPGDAVVVLTPVYHAFKKIIENSGRLCRPVPLDYGNGDYTINFSLLEDTFRSTRVKVLLFCNPHNPTGRTWSADDLMRLSQLCHTYHIFLISDEIYCDMIYDHRHISLLEYREVVDNHLMVCISPTKTFNLSGTRTGAVILPDAVHHSDYGHMLRKHKTNDRSMFGVIALQAAYEHGDAYRDHLLVYLKQNLNLLSMFLHQYVPELSLLPPAFGYMAWINAAVLEEKVAMPASDFLVRYAQVGVRPGTVFDNGDGFIRLSFGFPTTILTTALERIATAIKHV